MDPTKQNDNDIATKNIIRAFISSFVYLCLATTATTYLCRRNSYCAKGFVFGAFTVGSSAVCTRCKRC